MMMLMLLVFFRSHYHHFVITARALAAHAAQLFQPPFSRLFLVLLLLSHKYCIGERFLFHILL